MIHAVMWRKEKNWDAENAAKRLQHGCSGGFSALDTFELYLQRYLHSLADLQPAGEVLRGGQLFGLADPRGQY